MNYLILAGAILCTSNAVAADAQINLHIYHEDRGLFYTAVSDPDGVEDNISFAAGKTQIDDYYHNNLRNTEVTYYDEGLLDSEVTPCEQKNLSTILANVKPENGPLKEIYDDVKSIDGRWAVDIHISKFYKTKFVQYIVQINGVKLLLTGRQACFNDADLKLDLSQEKINQIRSQFIAEKNLRNPVQNYEKEAPVAGR